MTDCLHPEPSLLITLGSMIIHAEEFMSANGHPWDKQTFDTQLATPEVQAWIKQMNELALLPLKRNEA